MNLRRSSCEVPIILGLKKLEFTQQCFEKYSNTKFHKNPSSGNPVFHADRHTGRQTGTQTDRQTDMAKLILAFRSFANAPKRKSESHWCCQVWVLGKQIMFSEEANTPVVKE